MIEHPVGQENGAVVRVFSGFSSNVVSATLEGSGTFRGNAVNAAKSQVLWLGPVIDGDQANDGNKDPHGTPKQLDSPGSAIFDDIRGLWFRYSFVFCPLMEV